MMLRCDAPISIHITSALYGERTDHVRADMVETHLAIESIKHGKVSGYEGSAAPCKYRLTLDDPSFELKDGAECDCPKHQEGA